MNMRLTNTSEPNVMATSQARRSLFVGDVKKKNAEKASAPTIDMPTTGKPHRML